MDSYDLTPDPKPRRNPLIWNILTVLVLLSACGLAYVFYSIFTDQNSRFNPFPPAPTPTLYMTVTPTITIRPLDATWTSTVTIKPSPSRTKAPTWTSLAGLASLTPTETPTETLIVDTPTITNTPMPAVPTITYEASTKVHADSACAWMGVGGTVQDANGKALQFLSIHLGGTLDGKTINTSMVSGSAPDYGTSGFEFVLGNTPTASTQQLWIQLWDNTDKIPLSEQVYFDTFTDCSKNLVLVAFTKTR